VVTTYQRESSAIRDEVAPMLAAHHAETAVFADEMPLAPNFAAYEKLEQLGALRVYTARRDGSLIGYSVCLVSTSLHRPVVEANESLLYVVPEHRGKTVGVRLMRFVEAQLAAEGVQLLARRSKAGRPELDLGSMLTRMGYTPVETIYARRLGHG